MTEKDEILKRFRACAGAANILAQTPTIEVTVPLRWLAVASYRIEQAELLLTEARQWEIKGYPAMRHRIDAWMKSSHPTVGENHE